MFWGDSMQCDMCGSSQATTRAIVEQIEMTVCKDCSKFGQVLGNVMVKTAVFKDNIKNRITASRPLATEKQVQELVMTTYPLILRKKREQLGMTQKEFASLILEKESVLQKMETGHMEPSIITARKLERILKIKLVEEYEEDSSKGLGKKENPEQFTIGDIITVRKRN
jgi:putative transcription factor